MSGTFRFYGKPFGLVSHPTSRKITSLNTSSQIFENIFENKLLRSDTGDPFEAQILTDQNV